MKNLKIISLMCILILVALGCQTDNKRENTALDIDLEHAILSESPLVTTQSEQALEMSGLEIWQRGTGRGDRYQNLLEWHDYIIEKFGIEINISYDSKDNRIRFLNYYGEDGNIQPNNSIAQYFVLDFAYDLTSYISEYGWTQYIEQKELSLVTYNGKIVALPLKASEFIIPRYYNESYLEELDMDVPENTYELIQFLRGSKKINKGDEKFYPMFISSSSFMPSLADIFRAYNVYVNSNINATIEYNPNIGSFEDAVFSKDFEVALTYIRELQAEDLLMVSGRSYLDYGNRDYSNRFIESLFGINKNFATEHFSISNGTAFQATLDVQPTYDSLKGYNLFASNDRNTCEIRNNLVFYIFPNTIKNIKTVMEQFNMIMTDQVFSADIQYGIEDRNYRMVGNEVILIPPNIGGYVRLLPLIKQNSLSKDTSKALAGLGSETFYEKNVFNNILSYLNPEEYGIVIQIQEYYLKYLMYSDISPQDAIEMYKKEFKKYGFEKIINAINERLGQPTNYDYSE